MDFDGAVEAEIIGEGDKIFLQGQMTNLTVMAGGFILTSLIWASAVAKIIDRRFFAASIYFAVGGTLVLFGVMHSPLFGDKMFLPWQLSDENMFQPNEKILVVQLAIAYLVMALTLFVLGNLMDEKVINSDEEFDKLAEYENHQ